MLRLTGVEIEAQMRQQKDTKDCKAGSTGCIVVLTPGYIGFANVGDSRAILVDKTGSSYFVSNRLLFPHSHPSFSFILNKEQSLLFAFFFFRIFI